MSGRLASVLADLREETGATAADLTADELTDLVHACERVDSPFSDIHADLMGRPIRVAPGVTLWPITAGAQVWLDEFAAAWWPKGSAMYRWANVYALVHARNPDAFSRLVDKSAARRAILLSALRLAVHAPELERGILLAYGVRPHDEPPPERRRRDDRDDTHADFAALVARLEVASGISRDEWLWGRSLASLSRSYCELANLQAATLGSSRTECRLELDEAVANLARTCSRISRRLRATRQNAARDGGKAAD